MSGFAAGPPPVITVQPSNQIVLNGATAEFSVTASSGTTMSYQWYFGGSVLSGATSRTLTRTVLPTRMLDGFFPYETSAGVFREVNVLDLARNNSQI